MTRQAISTSRLTVPSIGNCTTDQTIAMTSKVLRVCILLLRKQTATAETANRKKNDEPIRPNCLGSRPSSFMIGCAASPTTTLSAKLISMKRKSRAVMPHAPFSGRSTSGRSCTVTSASLPWCRIKAGARCKEKGASRRPSPIRWRKSSALHERALALVERTVGLVAGHGGDQLVDVVLALGFRRRLHLEQVHVAHHAAVLAQLAVLGHDVVDRQLAHLGHHLLGVIVGAHRLHGLEVMQSRAVDAGGQHRRQAVLLGAIALGPGAGFVVEIPVERLGQHQ